MRGVSDLAARLDRAAESGGPEAVDLVIQQANAVQYALDLEQELARERAAHALTRAALARAYDTIAAVRKAVAGVQS